MWCEYTTVQWNVSYFVQITQLTTTTRRIVYEKLSVDYHGRLQLVSFIFYKRKTRFNIEESVSYETSYA